MIPVVICPVDLSEEAPPVSNGFHADDTSSVGDFFASTLTSLDILSSLSSSLPTFSDTEESVLEVTSWEFSFFFFGGLGLSLWQTSKA